MTHPVRKSSPRSPASLRQAPEAAGVKGERIQKLLAAAGLGSRREIEGWIEAGRIALNGRIAKLGDRAKSEDTLALDGQALRLSLAGGLPRVLLYNKPVGELVTRRDSRDRRTVFEALPPLKTGKWIAVGRLDLNSAGLLLFTNSGELANRLMHPRSGVVREYAVRAQGLLGPQMRSRLLDSVQLSDGPARFDTLSESDPAAGGTNRWYRVTIREGRNREVRRLFEAAGLRVSRLLRVRYGPVELPRTMKPGDWHELGSKQVEQLLALDVATQHARQTAGRTGKT